MYIQRIVRFTSVCLLLCCILSSCATTGEYCTPPPPPATGAVEFVIYRPHNRYGMLYAAPISIDGCIIDDLSDNAFIRYLAIPGKHVIRAEKRFLADGGDAEITVDSSTEQRLYIRYSMEEDYGVNRYLPAPPPVIIFKAHPADARFKVTGRTTAVTELPSLREALPAIEDNKPGDHQYNNAITN